MVSNKVLWYLHTKPRSGTCLSVFNFLHLAHLLICSYLRFYPTFYYTLSLRLTPYIKENLLHGTSDVSLRASGRNDFKRRNHKRNNSGAKMLIISFSPTWTTSPRRTYNFCVDSRDTFILEKDTISNMHFSLEYPHQLSKKVCVRRAVNRNGRVINDSFYFFPDWPTLCSLAELLCQTGENFPFLLIRDYVSNSFELTLSTKRPKIRDSVGPGFANLYNLLVVINLLLNCKLRDLRGGGVNFCWRTSQYLNWEL